MVRKQIREWPYAEAFVVDAAGSSEELAAATELVERIRRDIDAG